LNSQEAKTILSLCRPGVFDASDPQVAEALEQTRCDQDLRRWFEQSSAFHAAMREKFQQIPVPPDLKESLLAMNKIVRPAWWRQPAWLAAAAAIVLLLGGALFWSHTRPQDQFSEYRSRMVRTALRRYRMDIATNDLNQVRQFMARRGTPSDYTLPKTLEKLSVTGGVCLRWRGNPVSMVCFDRGDKQMLFLFVMARSALPDAPTAPSEVTKVNKLLTTSWTQGEMTYVLAEPENPALLRK